MDILCDVDGTLANIDTRVEMATRNSPPGKRMDWDVFLDPEVMRNCDRPNKDVVELVNALVSSGHNVIITSARNERHRDVTTWQMQQWNVPHVAMFMRDDEDFRKDSVVKTELLENIRSLGYNPTIAIDDRNQVVENWRELGLYCWQVRVTAA